MAKGVGLKFDEIGYWSEIKLDIVKDYAAAYSAILSKQANLYHLYIDAFAGPGVHISKRTGDFVSGSPLNALAVDPPFREYHFIDLAHSKVENLQTIATGRRDVFIHEGDCNDVLMDEVFPRVRFEDFRRALCLLDPYGLDLEWRVMEKAGQSKTIDMFLNFPIMDMNRNALWSNPRGVDPADAERMTAFWGSEAWKDSAYTEQGNLFGGTDPVKIHGNLTIVDAFQKRLRTAAGFKNVPKPIPMRNSAGAVVYYLFFASQNDVANKIVLAIFNKYGTRGSS